MAEALVRRRELTGDDRQRREKQRAKEEQRRRRRSFIGRPRKQGEATAMPFPRQREAKTATRAPGTPKKVAGGELASAVTVHSNYKFAIRQNSQITLKFS